MTTYLTSALYKFVHLDDPAALREPLLALCVAQGVRGTLLLAHEGINGTIAGLPEGVHAVLGWLRADPRLADLEDKQSWFHRPPFQRMKVRVKQEIVGLHVPGLRPADMAGQYVDARNWNALIDDPDVVLVDTRNAYEVAFGTFDRALDPGTRSFSDLPAWVATQSGPGGVLAEREGRKPRVAMFCTGGIRCEKSTAYLRSQGFDEVYHLRGGILKYLETVPQAESRWQGQCFVFDERVSVGHGLVPGPAVAPLSAAAPAPAGRHARAPAAAPAVHGERPQRIDAPLLDDPVTHLLRTLNATRPGLRRIVGLTGLPGSGKTTLAERLVLELNQRMGAPVSVALGVDGFHLSRAQLAARPNAEAALARRGAPWTFNPTALAVALRQLRQPDRAGRPQHWPAFSHALGDPQPDAIEVPAAARLLLVEGLYLLHHGDGWDLEGLLDECGYLDTPRSVARERLLARHMSAWDLDRAAARQRIEANDARNGRIVRRSRHRADWRVLDGG